MEDKRIAVIPWWIFASFIAVGAIMLAVGGIWASRVSHFIAGAGRAPGEIVDFDSYVSDDGETMYKAVIRYTVESGQEYEVLGSTGTSWKPEVGKRLTMLYDPANPQEASPDSFWSQWLGPVVFLGLGGVFALIGIGLWYFLGGKPVAVSDGPDFMMED